MAKDLISFPDMVSNNGSIETLASAIRKAAAPSNKFTGKNTFKATVLRKIRLRAMSPQDLQNMQGIEAGSATRDRGGGSQGYYVMVTEDHPHHFLPDPCFQGNTSALKVGNNKILQGCYTTAIWSGDPLTEGDDVMVRFEHKDFSYNTDICFIVQKIGPNLNRNKKDRGGCVSPKDRFNNGTIGQLGHGQGRAGSYDSLLDFIASGEGGYNSMNQGTVGDRIVGSTHDASTILGKNLTEMTVGEVMAAQQSSPRKLFAAGRYQIIPDTMIKTVRITGMSKTWMFNEENQDILGKALIYDRPNLAAYLEGRSDNIREAHLDFAKEWASIPDPDTGYSFYGFGNQALHTVEEVQIALFKERSKNIAATEARDEEQEAHAALLGY